MTTILRKALIGKEFLDQRPERYPDSYDIIYLVHNVYRDVDSGEIILEVQGEGESRKTQVPLTHRGFDILVPSCERNPEGQLTAKTQG